MSNQKCPTCGDKRASEPGTVLVAKGGGVLVPETCPTCNGSGLADTKAYLGEIGGVPIISDPKATKAHLRSPLKSDPSADTTEPEHTEHFARQLESLLKEFHEWLLDNKEPDNGLAYRYDTLGLCEWLEFSRPRTTVTQALPSAKASGNDKTDDAKELTSVQDFDHSIDPMKKRATYFPIPATPSNTKPTYLDCNCVCHSSNSSERCAFCKREHTEDTKPLPHEHSGPHCECWDMGTKPQDHIYGKPPYYHRWKYDSEQGKCIPPCICQEGEPTQAEVPDLGADRYKEGLEALQREAYLLARSDISKSDHPQGVDVLFPTFGAIDSKLDMAYWGGYEDGRASRNKEVL